jgi:hypothetical protein
MGTINIRPKTPLLHIHDGERGFVFCGPTDGKGVHLEHDEFDKVNYIIIRSAILIIWQTRRQHSVSVASNSHYDADPLLRFCVSGILPRLFAAESRSHMTILPK